MLFKHFLHDFQMDAKKAQRLLIARALYKNPDYLFLNEATNALDTINEQKIVAALNNIFNNWTITIIAH